MARLGVSAYCATYGRIACLENSIQCFLDQDYDGEKELVILNDRHDQELVFDHPEVRIINVKERIQPLGKKFNENVKLCKYPLIAVWENDDVMLPHRLSYQVNNLKNGIHHSNNQYCENDVNSKLSHATNIFHSALMFSKELFDAVGGYDESDVCSIDVSIMNKFYNHLGYRYTTTCDNPYYVYVWGGANSYHGSGLGPDFKQVSKMAEDIIDMQQKQGIEPTGVIHLKPHYRRNWMELFP